MSEWTSIVPSDDLFSLLQGLHAKLEAIDRRLGAIEAAMAPMAQSSRRANTADRRSFPALGDDNGHTNHIRSVNRAIRSKVCVPFDSTIASASK